jgi:hypothetical protein
MVAQYGGQFSPNNPKTALAGAAYPGEAPTMDTQSIIAEYNRVSSEFGELLRTIVQKFTDHEDRRKWSNRLQTALDCGTVRGQIAALATIRADLNNLNS